MPLPDPRRLLRQCLWGQLVGRRVLPFARSVGRLAVLLRRDDLTLASDPEAGQHELFDLTSFRLRPRLSRAPFELAHHAAFDHGFQGVHAQGRLGTDQPDALVAVRSRGADQLMVGRPQPLAVQVVNGSDSVQDHATGSRLAVRGNRQHLVDAASELRARDHLGQHSAQCLIELEGAA